MKKILGILSIFILASSVTLSCPDKNFHDNVREIIRTLDEDVLITKSGTMYIDLEKFLLYATIAFPNDEAKRLSFAKDIFAALELYCQNHGLKLKSLG